MNSTSNTQHAPQPLRDCVRACTRFVLTAWRRFRTFAGWTAVVVLCLPLLLWRLIVDPQDKEDPWRGPE